jgi:5-formyltetrahydrofolate cyclo-ligase
MNKTNLPTSDKKTLRAIVQEKIAHMSIDEKKKESTEVCLQITESLATKNFKTIIIYHAFDDEIDISQIALWWEQAWKNVLAIPQSTEAFQIPENSILIVPWRAFTKEWKRIGRGSGYYDRLLEKYSNIPTIGVCFACQVLGDIPEENWDKRVDEVVFARNILE